jgi:hypothetical protein
MAYSIFIWNPVNENIGELFSGTIHFGTNWWIEKELNKEEISYKIVDQKIINGQKFICTKKMNKGWCGENYLGNEHISTKRSMYSNLFSIPESQAEWLMSSKMLSLRT